jgi:hypothetical protein
MTRTAASSARDNVEVERATRRAALGTKAFVAGLRRLTAEPFAHFTLLGALVFAGHHLVTGRLEPPTIDVSASKQREIVKLFEQRQKRAPNDDERAQLIRRYVEDEALYREGLRLSLVETDPMLRAQIIARVRGMLQAELDLTPPTDAELARYFEAHRSDYAAGGVIAPTLESVRERVKSDYRKERTSRAFQEELARLTSRWRVDIAEP